MPPDYLDFDPEIMGHMVDTSLVDTARFRDNPALRDPRATPGRNLFDDRREPGVSYLPSRTIGSRNGNIEFGMRFPSMADGRDSVYAADMAVRRQLKAMEAAVRTQGDPASAGLLIDDMGQLKDGYRGLKAAGWDPSEASQAALSVGGAFGSNADFANRAEYLRGLAVQRGTTMGTVAKQLGEQRSSFSKQYLADLGFVGGLQPSPLDGADADDLFADAFSAIKDVEDRFDYVFDRATVNGILKEVSRTSAGLARRGMSASEYGMDKVVEAAMYKVGALSGGDAVSTPIGRLDSADEDDRRSLTWSDFEWDYQDPAKRGENGTYGQMKHAQAGTLEQDFSLTRGIRDAFAEHRVRNLRSGRDVDDWSDTELLRQGIVGALRSNSMSVKGLTDEDFGQLADAIIEKRMNGEKVSVTNTIRDMLFTPVPGQLTSAERRGYAHNVSGKWGETYNQYLAKLATGDFDPKLSSAELRENVDQMLKTSGMNKDAQSAIYRMTESFVKDYAYRAGKLLQEGSETPGRHGHQYMKHRITQLAQAAQLVSVLDAARQGRLLNDDEFNGYLRMIYDEKDPSKINLGVLHNVDAGFLHDASKDTMSNWLLETKRTGQFFDVFPESVDKVWANSETRVRDVNSDPLEKIWRDLDARFQATDTPGLGYIRKLARSTVEVMDAYRKVYDNLPKDSQGNLRSSHVFSLDNDTAKLFTREDVPRYSMGNSATTGGLLTAGVLGGAALGGPLGAIVGAIPGAVSWLYGELTQSTRKQFDKDNVKLGRAIDELQALGAFVPGLEADGFDASFQKTALVGRWDNIAEATIDAGKSLGGRVLAGVDPEKARAWSEWADDQTMNSANAREACERVAQGIVRSAMAKFPGVSESDPRYRQALQNAYRFVKGKMVEGDAIRGIDDINEIGDELLEKAAVLNTRPNGDRGGHRAFGGDFQLMQEMQAILAPLQEASQREYTQARQSEEQQAAILRASLDADSAARRNAAEGAAPEIPPEVAERINRAEQEKGSPLTQQERDAIINNAV